MTPAPRVTLAEEFEAAMDDRISGPEGFIRAHRRTIAAAMRLAAQADADERDNCIRLDDECWNLLSEFRAALKEEA